MLTDLLKKIPYKPDKEDATVSNKGGDTIAEMENFEVNNVIIEDKGTQIVEKILSDLVNSL